MLKKESNLLRAIYTIMLKHLLQLQSWMRGQVIYQVKSLNRDEVRMDGCVNRAHDF